MRELLSWSGAVLQVMIEEFIINSSQANRSTLSQCKAARMPRILTTLISKMNHNTTLAILSATFPGYNHRDTRRRHAMPYRRDFPATTRI